MATPHQRRSRGGRHGQDQRRQPRRRPPRRRELVEISGQPVSSSALDINDAGQVVGEAGTDAGLPHAFRWVDGTVVEIPALGGAVYVAAAINEAGLVVGGSATEAAVEYGGVGTHGFKWENGTLNDLGTFNGPSVSAAIGIDDDGWITGYGVQDGQFRGFILKPR